MAWTSSTSGCVGSLAGQAPSTWSLVASSRASRRLQALSKTLQSLGPFLSSNWNENECSRIKPLFDLAGLYLWRSPERWWEVSYGRRVSSTVPLAALKPPRRVAGSAFTAVNCYKARDAV